MMSTISISIDLKIRPENRTLIPTDTSGWNIPTRTIPTLTIGTVIDLNMSLIPALYLKYGRAEATEEERELAREGEVPRQETDSTNSDTENA